MRAAGRADVGLAAGDPDREGEDVGDHVGGDARAVVGDPDRAVADIDLDTRGDAGLLAGVEAVVDQLLDGDLRPLLRPVADLAGELARGGEIQQARGVEGLAGGSERIHGVTISTVLARIYKTPHAATWRRGSL